MKLGAKMSISMVFLVLLATLIAAVLAGKTVRTSFDQYIDKNFSFRLERAEVVLAEYYQVKGGWEDVQELFENQRPRGRGMGQGYGRVDQGESRTGHGMGPGLGALMSNGTGDILLVDSNGKVAAASNHEYLGKTAHEVSLRQSVPVKVNESVVGTLALVNTRHGILESDFISSVNKAIIRGAAVASIIALVLAIIVSGRLTGPLSMLTDAARRLAGRDLSCRVSVATNDEIGELADSFNYMAESLERNEKLRKNLITDIAHELRTPLAILRGNLESLQEGVITGSPEVIISLHDEVVRISRLVNELQDISLADAGELRLNCRAVPVGDLVEKAAVPFSGEAKNKNVHFSVNIPADLPLLHVDPDRIVQVLLNILGNALRYTQPGGKIELSAVHGGDNVIFSVKDTGTGIAPQDLANIFERFYRSEQSRVRSGGGSGLGLAIAKSFVEAHGGSIWAKSKVNKGSNFSFTVPISKNPNAGAGC